MEYVKEAFIEKNVRSDFIRVLYQPNYAYHILSKTASQTLSYLLSCFYSHCTVQRDFTNALKLHKITSILLIKEDSLVPFYAFLKNEEVYSKVGFWKELLVDYCTSTHVENAYRMNYKVQKNNQSTATKRNKLTQSMLEK